MIFDEPFGVLRLSAEMARTTVTNLRDRTGSERAVRCRGLGISLLHYQVVRPFFGGLSVLLPRPAVDKELFICH
jgi:hypothetical protein